MGSKARLCKHTVGLMLKTEIIEIDSDVRSKPLGQKRKRDRPKKLPSCLARSPEQPVWSVMTRVTSPNVSHLNSTIVGQSVSPLNTTAIMSPISVMSIQKKRVRKIETQVDLDSPPPLPPAKRISRQKVHITFYESPDKIVNVRKKSLRSNKNKKWEWFDFYCQNFPTYLPIKRYIYFEKVILIVIKG